MCENLYINVVKQLGEIFKKNKIMKNKNLCVQLDLFINKLILY